MSKGVLIFAYNSKLDYISIATICAKLVKKHLNLPVSIVTDTLNVDHTVFDTVIINGDKGSYRQRTFKYHNRKETTPWYNKNRSSAYDLSPYDQTLLIDADYLMFNDSLKWLFDSNLEFACYDKVYDISGYEGLTRGARVGNPGIHMQWATVVYFTKSELAKNVFDFMKCIKENYEYYALAYNFSTELFRNDYSISIALQSLTGYSQSSFTAIPGYLTTANTGTEIAEVRPNGDIVFTWVDKDHVKKVTKLRGTNIHIMNKSTIVDPVVLQGLEVLAQ